MRLMPSKENVRVGCAGPVRRGMTDSTAGGVRVPVEQRNLFIHMMPRADGIVVAFDRMKAIVEIELTEPGYGSLRRDGADRIHRPDWHQQIDGLALHQLDPFLAEPAREHHFVDVGRERRLFDRHQKVAINHRYAGCAAHNCDRPPAWMEYHHEDPWHQGGHTDASNGISLCPPHHRMADHPQTYDMTKLPNGKVRFSRRQ